MTFEELKHDLQNDYGRLNFREVLMLRRAYDAGRNQNLEEWKVLEKNYDDLYTRERWTFLKTKDDLPSPRDDRKVLTWFRAGAGQPGGATVLEADRFSEGGGVIAWKEITPPEEPKEDD